jgi:hypothetical protein
MKLFQIEEPDGTPADRDAPGIAVGIELSAAKGAAVAVAVGGNAELLAGADGATRLAARFGDEREAAELLLGLRERAEKALARPVTHAVVALDLRSEPARRAVTGAAPAAGLVLLRLVDADEAAARAPGAAPADAPVLGAAIQAEDDAAALLR